VLNVSTLLPAGMLLYNNTSKVMPFVNAAVNEEMGKCDNLLHSSTKVCLQRKNYVMNDDIT